MVEQVVGQTNAGKRLQEIARNRPKWTEDSPEVYVDSPKASDDSPNTVSVASGRVSIYPTGRSNEGSAPPSPTVTKFEKHPVVALDALRVFEIHQHSLRRLDDEVNAGAGGRIEVAVG